MENQWSNSRLSLSPCMQGDEAEGGIDTLLQQDGLPETGNTKFTWNDWDAYANRDSEHDGALPEGDCAHNALDMVSATCENQDDGQIAFYNMDNGVLPYPTVDPVGPNPGHNPFASNTENTWNDYGPSYYVYDPDGTLAQDSMLATTAIGQVNAFQSLPSTSINQGPFFSANGPYSIANTIGAAWTEPTVARSAALPSVNNAALPSINSAALTSYAPLPNLSVCFPCTHLGCTKDFKRRSEMVRHYRQVHDPFGLKLNCSYTGCSRHGLNGFARNDKLRDHQRAVHGAAL